MNNSVAASPHIGHGTFHRAQGIASPSEQRLGNLGQPYGSDLALNRSKQEKLDESTGRRSSMDRYSPQEAGSQGPDSRKSKKKKMKRFRGFMHVFLGGLRREPSVHGSQELVHQTPHNKLNDQQQNRQDKIRSVSSSPTPRSPGVGRTAHRQTSLPPPSTSEVPGLCGLHNHGNTCFMNAILQCLSNTDQLAEYMVTDQYKNDINKHKMSGQAFGSQGAITEQFSVLLKCLWNGQYDPRVTGKFKEVISRHARQYQGSSQHDAQEFFLWLLDSVHEDLNQASKKKYRPIKDSTGRPDEEVAAETLQSHRKRNNSFIQNLFQGQFRSTITCPSCGTRSSTFDPYVCVSIPLPQREKRPIYVTIVYRSSSRPNRVFGVDMPIDSTIRDLRNSLAEQCGASRHHLVLTDLLPTGFHRTFYDDQHLSVINSGDLVFGFECPPYRGDNMEAISRNNPSGSKELMLVLVMNKLGQTQFGKRFGPPLILRIWRDLTHLQFQSVVLKSMIRYLRECVNLADVCRSGKLFRCRVMDGLPGRAILPIDADHPFYSPSIDKALDVSMLYGGPAHIKVIAEWEPEVKARIFGVVADDLPEPHQSVHQLRQVYQQPLTATLQDCLNIYTKEETLNREDSWFCPHCKRQQQDATKKITLWTLPDVLVIHLKRFRHVGYCRTKLNTLITFPIHGLDMSCYLAPRSSQRPSSATFQRHVQTSAAATRAKTFSAHSKSVRFEDASAAKTTNKNVSSKDKKFHFLWRKKRRDEDASGKHSEAIFSPGICDSPSSIRSAPSAVGRSVSRGRVNSPVHSLDGGDLRSATPVEGNERPTENDIYVLYAVCNHHGNMSRGHYTAYCRNPMDRHWYQFDDSHVQPVLQDQLVTAGAYLLFYVRQSLLKLPPPLSSASTSSSSSASSTHWALHIPRFRLDLGSSVGSSDGTHSPNENKDSHLRLGSSNSAMSAPPVIHGYSPDNDVFLHNQGGGSNPSAVSVHNSSTHQRHHTSPSHIHQLSSSPKHAQTSAGLNGRHASLRVGRRHFSPDAVPTDDHHHRRGTSFHGSQHYHNMVQRSLTDSGHVMKILPNPAFPSSGQGLTTPSRSIPNISAANYAAADERSVHPLPSRSIPDMSVAPSTPSARPLEPHHNYSTHFMTPQPSRPRNASSRSFSTSHQSSSGGAHRAAESCV